MEESAEAAAPPAEEAPPPAEEAAEEPPPRELLPHEVAQQKADAARATLNRNVAHRASLGMLGDDIFNEQKTVDAELEAQNAKKPKKAKQAGGPTLRERLGRGAKYAYAVVFPYLHERAMARQPATGKTPLMMVMSALKMTKRDAARFLRLFEKIDSNHSGTIDIEEFFDYLRTDISGYTRKAFAMMEIKTEEMGQHGEIDAAKARALAKKERQKARRVKKRGGTYVKNIELHYAEFFVALFNFLTLTNERIVRFTFDLIDEDKSGYLSKDEVFEMVRLMATTEEEVQAKVQKLMNVLDANGDGRGGKSARRSQRLRSRPVSFSADFWTNDHPSGRARRVDVFFPERARGTLTLKRRRIAQATATSSSRSSTASTASCRR
jgi:Ca2+-binding EF-hand superfamily protein